jgi:hypothetical protein
MIFKKTIQLLLIPFLVVLVVSGVLKSVDVNRNDFMLGLSIKDSLATNVSGNKLLINGGSNLIFGFKSEISSKALNRPTINMGLMAGLGLEFMVNQVKEYAHEGDIVVLVPEYFLYVNPKSSLDNPVVLSAISSCPETKRFVNDVSIIKLQHLLIQSKLSKMIHDWSPIENKSIFKFENINSKGELSKNQKTLLSKKNFDNYKFPINFDQDLSQVETTIKSLNELSEFFKKKGVRFYVSFPPISNNVDVIADAMELYELIVAKGIKTIGKPDDFSFPRSSFYDGIPHLIFSAAKKRTLIFNGFMKRALIN